MRAVVTTRGGSRVLPTRPKRVMWTVIVNQCPHCDRSHLHWVRENLEPSLMAGLIERRCASSASPTCLWRRSGRSCGVGAGDHAKPASRRGHDLVFPGRRACGPSRGRPAPASDEASGLARSPRWPIGKWRRPGHTPGPDQYSSETSTTPQKAYQA
jgi:hypothetical protein